MNQSMSAGDQGGGNGGAPAVRVVIISTQYIETDPANFKSVVQSLTGKHSHHIHSNHQELPLPPKRRKLSPPPPSFSEVATSSTAAVMVSSRSSRSNNDTNSSSLPSTSIRLSRGVSLSDLYRLHTLPSWEEISELCM